MTDTEAYMNMVVDDALNADPIGQSIFSAQSAVEELARLWNDPATRKQVQAELPSIYRIFSNSAALVDVMMREEGLMPPPPSKVVYLDQYSGARGSARGGHPGAELGEAS